MPTFLIFAIVAFTVATIFIETECWGWATISLAVSVAAAHYLAPHFKADLIGYVQQHAFLTIAYVVGFLAIGVVWSFVKWFSYLYRVRDRYRKARARSYHGAPVAGRPMATDNRGKIIGWMALWPFSLVGTLLNDPVRRLFRFIFNLLRSWYQRAADHVFRNDP